MINVQGYPNKKIVTTVENHAKNSLMPSLKIYYNF